MAKSRQYDGDGIRVGYDARRCIHAAECVRGLPEVFDPERRPWIQPRGAAADRLAEVVMRCPSGALTFERLDGGLPEQALLRWSPRGDRLCRPGPLGEGDGPPPGRGRVARPEGAAAFGRSARPGGRIHGPGRGWPDRGGIRRRHVPLWSLE